MTGRISIFIFPALSACITSKKFDLEALNPFKNTDIDKEADKTYVFARYEGNDLISTAPTGVNVDVDFLKAMRAAISIIVSIKD